MITRTIGSILRGKATPAQVLFACILGSMLGFIPGFAQGPGLFITLSLLLIVMNANLIAAAAVGVLAKLASLMLMPVSFAVGRALLDGPTRPLFKPLINAPVLALFGFEHYATTGGMVVGFLFGLAAGAIILKAVRTFRKRMATVEESSETYRKYANRWWVKALAFVFLGKGHGKLTYADLLKRRVGNPIRPIGVVFALLVVALLVVAQMFFSGPIVAAYLQRGLERANGATVDVGEVELDLSAGRLVITDLAMADPNALDTDLLRASRVEGEISSRDLLRRRFAIDRVVVADASTGEKRVVPGRRVGRLPIPTPEPRLPGDKTIEDYVREAEKWKQRLAQVREWLDRVSGPGEEEPPVDPETGEPRRETIRERLEREVREKGYARVVASHLIEGAPTMLVRELVAEGVRTEQLEGEVLDIRAENLSTHPGLVDGAPRITVTSRSERLRADVLLGGASRARTASTLDFALRGVPGDEVGRALSFVGEPPVQGGTVDLSAKGELHAGRIDLPLNVTLHDATVAAPGAGSAHVDRLAIPIGLAGPLDNPRINVSPDLLADALIQAGASELAGRIKGQADKAIEKATEDIGDKIGDEARKRIGDILGGDRSKKPSGP